MKSRIPDHRQSTTPSPKVQAAKTSRTALPPELAAQYGQFTPAERLQLAHVLNEHAQALIASVHGSSLPVKKAPASGHAGAFIKLNMDIGTQRELRSKCREMGYTLRQVLNWALNHAVCDLRDEHKLFKKCGLDRYARNTLLCTYKGRDITKQLIKN